MNISIFPHNSPVAIPVATPRPPNSVSAGESKPSLVVSDARSSGVDAMEMASITDADLARDDALGLLVSSAFRLPPPPMPAFPSTSAPPVSPGLSEVRV